MMGVGDGPLINHFCPKLAELLISAPAEVTICAKGAKFERAQHYKNPISEYKYEPLYLRQV